MCLHAAAKRGHAAVVKSLLLKGAHVDATTKDGQTALHIAVQNCKPQVVQMLLGFGAQVQLRGGKVTRHLLQALSYIIFHHIALVPW